MLIGNNAHSRSPLVLYADEHSTMGVVNNIHYITNCHVVRKHSLLNKVDTIVQFLAR